MSHNFPTILEVVTIHSVLIEEFGGTPGIRDQGALASALMRPQLGYYSGLIEEAAALMESLANNHPFEDGNKRVAFFVTDAFLRLNGQYIECDSLEAFEFFMRLFETNSFRYAALLPWLEAKVQPLPGH
ncbi:MAG: type II toxin-antitoxin system death-on-curing family toxin [Caldilineaceae bacterium]|nr:type II toxin-antitoxin system death-on-curing family toxin [Caldilineaceae bacterium]